MTTTAVMNGQDITITSSQLSSPYTIKRVEADPLTGEYDRIAGLMSKHLQLALAAGDNLNVAMDEVGRSAEKLIELKNLYDGQSIAS
ncbi:MAG: hypothetical protein Q8R82_07460, partial [Hyphomonadaceae bacterium]|nr:hypothetical protein [Hyphomonadaceae bacterium]